MASTHERAASASLPTTAADIRNILVIGAGQMGSGIAQAFAQGGRRVWLHDTADGAVDRARAGISKSAGKLHSKGRLTEQQLAAVTDDITYCADLADVPLGDIDLAIEAIVEREDAKVAVLSSLDAGLAPGAILASNTSSIPITRLAAATSRPRQVIGMHFMNPVPVLELVEVIPGLDTDDEVTTLTCDLARELAKVPVLSSDAPGFITNRILMPMINEAFVCLNEGVGTAEAIDDAMRLGMRHPLGPLALADLIGLDTCLSIMEVLHRDLGDDKYRPSTLLRRYVDAGRLGRKSGHGVYAYGDPAGA